MKKSVVVLLHIGFWICYVTLIIIMLMVYYKSGLYQSDPGSRIRNAFNTILLFVVFPSVISYFLYFYLLFPKYIQRKKYLPAFLYGMIISLVASVIGYIVLRYCIESGSIRDMDENGKNGRSTAVRVIIFMAAISTICGIVALVIKGFVTWVDEIKMKENLTEKTHAMEMALVKSQLDPHLLFNTINNIDTLILKDQVAASEYLNRLSDIMRFILYETKTEKILLAREIEYIQKYIELQKIRTANEHYVNFTVTGTPGKIGIAPMVFIPFIENAFKHATNKKLENAVTVKVVILEKTIELLCENRYDSVTRTKPVDSGLGNELIEKRLELIYAGKQSLDVQKTKELYRINLTIPHG